MFVKLKEREDQITIKLSPREASYLAEVLGAVESCEDHDGCAFADALGKSLYELGIRMPSPFVFEGELFPASIES